MFLIPPSYYKIKTTKKKGRGVFASRDIEAGAVIGDYIGKIVRPEDENEKRDGLYTMSGGDRFDLLASPKQPGIHLINHGCAQNCIMYPYRGHTLFIALRKIFADEELIINYMLGEADEKEIPCSFHACHCGSKICTGSMHDSEEDYENWEKLTKRASKPWGKKMPGKYGEPFPMLDEYPISIDIACEPIGQFNIFGSEKKSPANYNDAALPSLSELRKRIRETGRQLSFSKIHIKAYGIQRDKIIAERI
jgi:uncharacterized protein